MSYYRVVLSYYHINVLTYYRIIVMSNRMALSNRIVPCVTLFPEKIVKLLGDECATLGSNNLVVNSGTGILSATHLLIDVDARNSPGDLGMPIGLAPDKYVKY